MVAGISSHFLPESRMSASKVPKNTPPMVATTVSMRLKYNPLSTKLEIRSQL